METKLIYSESNREGDIRKIEFKNSESDMTIDEFIAKIIYPLLVSIGYSNKLINDVFNIDEVLDRGFME